MIKTVNFKYISIVHIISVNKNNNNNNNTLKIHRQNKPVCTFNSHLNKSHRQMTQSKQIELLTGKANKTSQKRKRQ